MPNEYREVVCPFCQHKFMWDKQGNFIVETVEYRLKENGKITKKAKCPKCEKEMLVLEGETDGIYLNDPRIEKFGIRGI